MKLKKEQETASVTMAEAFENKRRHRLSMATPPHAKLLSEPSSKPFVMGGKTKLSETHFGF